MISAEVPCNQDLRVRHIKGPAPSSFVQSDLLEENITMFLFSTEINQVVSGLVGRGH